MNSLEKDLLNVVDHYLKAGRYKEAEDLLDATIKLGLDSHLAVEMCVSIALTAIDKKEFDAAKRFLLRSERIFPTKYARDLLEAVKLCPTSGSGELGKNPDDANDNVGHVNDKANGDNTHDDTAKDSHKPSGSRELGQNPDDANDNVGDGNDDKASGDNTHDDTAKENAASKTDGEMTMNQLETSSSADAGSDTFDHEPLLKLIHNFIDAGHYDKARRLLDLAYSFKPCQLVVDALAILLSEMTISEPVNVRGNAYKDTNTNAVEKVGTSKHNTGCVENSAEVAARENDANKGASANHTGGANNGASGSNNTDVETDGATGAYRSSVKGDEIAVSKCMVIADTALTEGDLTKAKRFLAKGKRICPSDNQQLLRDIEAAQRGLEERESLLEKLNDAVNKAASNSDTQEETQRDIDNKLAAEQYLRRAELASAQKDYNTAERFLLRADLISPSSKAKLMLLNVRRAKEHTSGEDTADHDDLFNIYTRRIQEAIDQDNLDDAETLLREVKEMLDKDKKSPNSGQSNVESIGAYSLKEVPENTEAAYQKIAIARDRLEKGDLEKAEELLIRAGRMRLSDRPKELLDQVRADLEEAKKTRTVSNQTPKTKENVLEKSQEPPKRNIVKDEDASECCSICLDNYNKKSFADPCLHQFCFSCLVKWSKVKPECPVCKRKIDSIIHNVRDNNQYDVHEVDQRRPREDEDLRFEDILRPRRRWQSNPRHQPRVAMSEFPALLPVIPLLPVEVVRRPLVNPTPRNTPVVSRHEVYARNLWAERLPDAGTPRICSPKHYRSNRAAVQRLQPWIDRDLQVLLDDGELVSVARCVIGDLLLLHRFKSREFKQELRQHLEGYTDQFVHELLCFASSPLEMRAYDRAVQYCARAPAPAPGPSGLYTVANFLRIYGNAQDLDSDDD